MRGSYDVLFATTNRHKWEEAEALLAARGISARRCARPVAEVQAGTLEGVAAPKAVAAHRACGGPLIVEDDGLFVDALGGFPGPYSAHAYSTLGCAGLLRLLGGRRSASFRAVVAYSDGGRPRLFRGEVRGRIARREAAGGWGYDPVFVPEGSRATFARMADKSAASHRARAVGAFADWFCGRRAAGRRA